MAIVKRVVGQITLKVIRDVASTTYYYLLQSSMAPAPSTPSTNPPTGWSTTEPDFFTYQLTEDTEIILGKQYYTRTGESEPYTYTVVTTPVAENLNTYYERVYGDTKSLYVTVQTLYTDNTYDYSQPSLSSSYEAAKVAYNRAVSAETAVGNLNQFFWNTTSPISEGIPAGVYVTSVASNIFERDKTGGNVLIQSGGITVRDGITPLASLTGQSLNFYNPRYNTSAISIGNYGILLRDETGQEVASFNQDGIEFSSNVAQKIGGQNNYIAFDPVTDNITISGSNINFEPLSRLEDVVGTSEWIERHGNYILTADTAVQDKKSYYRQDEYVFITADSEIDINKMYYTAAITEIETPVVEDIELYFELKNGQYMQTHDTEIDETKTYYTVDLTYVEEPSAESFSTYYEQVFNYQAITAKGNPSEQNLYELQFDDVVSNYINTHLSLTNEGLYVLSNEKAFVKTRDTEIISAKEYYTRSGTEGNYTYTKVENPVVADIPLYFEEGNGYKVLLSSQDLRIIDSTGITTATYGDSIGFDETREFSIGNENVYIKYFDSDNDTIADSIAIKADEIIFGNESLGATIGDMSEDIETANASVNEINTIVQGISDSTQESVSHIENTVSTYDQRIKDVEDFVQSYDGYIVINPKEPSITVGSDRDSYIKVLSKKTSTFKLTEDTEIVESKEYYIRTQGDEGYIYTLVENPVASELPDYYEIESTTKQSKLQLVADNKEVAYLSDERLHAPSAVVNNLYMQTVNAMTGETIGGIGWVMRSNGHLSMRRMK